MNNRTVSVEDFETELLQLKERFSLLERRLSLKADEVVSTMAISHRKQIDELKDEVFRLRDELKKVQKGQKEKLIDRVVRRQRRVV
ncbi:hypothetical protein LCM20_07265 [Halobacillus litoralis]|uniref:hypothetical protein n=1 Tax=Halobacillus litoralis TaxID=45668 RepID=UPI001CD5E7E2|nr:hypothetical protein [Halobacillus litoralis]MCA0970384.1 hypothetical protein [Halobacillus litoralis]